MLINRNELRTALAAGLVNGFGSLTGLPFSFYAPLATLAVGTGTYGGSLALGRQRILGTLLGSALLLVGNRGLAGLPMPLGLAITLAALRLFGGLLRLEVGYKVGGLIVVMGWLVHDTDLGAWIPLRLIWTVFGILIALLSLRLCWPTRALDLALAQQQALLADLADCLQRLALAVDPEHRRSELVLVSPTDCRRLRMKVLALRQLRAALQDELGSNAERHPALGLFNTLEQASSRLILVVRGLVRQAPPQQNARLLQSLHQAEAALLGELAERLTLWQQGLVRQGRRLPQPPQAPLPTLECWEQINSQLEDPQANGASLERLQRIASRLLLCRQVEQAIVSAETSWRQLLRSA